MTHALRQNCGSFLYDSIRSEWGIQQTPSEREKASEKEACRLHHYKHGAAEEMDQQKMTVKCAPKEWPLFSAPGLSSLRVVGHKDRGGTLYFTVMAILEGFKWKIDRTYDEFVELQRDLVRQYNMDHPLLPSYTRFFGFSLFGSTIKLSQLTEMKALLEAFVMSAVSSFSIPPTELLKFVEYPFTDVLSVTQSLAKFFYIEGEMVLANNKAIQMSPLQLHCINKRMTLPIASSDSGKMKDDFGHLLDFLQNLKRLKIAPPTGEHAAIADVDSMSFDLNLMKSLEVLLIECINIHQLEARYSLPKQLVKLEVRRSLKFLQDILLVYPVSDVDHSPAVPNMPPLFSSTQAVDLSRALCWEKLEHANFKLNGIKKLDESVKMLIALEQLDLSYNYIEEIEHLVELPHLRVLDFSHNKITRLTELHTKLGNITKLGLSSNSIVKLRGIEKMFSLQYLDISNNQILDVTEVQYLDPLPCLEKLFLKGNPICTSLSYRSQVFSHLQQYAEQVALDGKLPSKDELVVSIGTPTGGHKRVPSRTPDIKPDEEEEERPEALEEMEAGMSMTTRLEELRKEGGDKWLSILNAEKSKEGDDGEVVANKSPKTPTSKKKKAKHGHHKPKSKKVTPEQEEAKSSLSQHLQDLIEQQQGEPLPNRVNFSTVTVLEYRNSAFLSLTPDNIDQILLYTPMEACTLSIDTLMAKALEIDHTAKDTRATRDLRLIYHLKLHEGKRLAVCLQMCSSRSSSLGGSRWVLYCLQDANELARLYCILNAAMARCRSLTPERPLVEVLDSIKSEASSSSLPEVPPTTITTTTTAAATTADPSLLSETPPLTAISDSSHLHGAPPITASTTTTTSDSNILAVPPHSRVVGGASPFEDSLALTVGTEEHHSKQSSSTGHSREDLSKSSEAAVDMGDREGSSASDLLLPRYSKSPSNSVNVEDEMTSSLNQQQTNQLVSSGALSSSWSSSQPPAAAEKGMLMSAETSSTSALTDSVSPSLLSPGPLSPSADDHNCSSSYSDRREQVVGKQKSSDLQVPPVDGVHLPVHTRVDEGALSKHSSASSSRAASGRNTPKTLHKTTTSSSSKRHSPARQGTPPVSRATNKPPQELSSDIITAKLKSLASPLDMTLASPLYNTEDNHRGLHGPADNGGGTDIVDSSEGGGGGKETGFYGNGSDSKRERENDDSSLIKEAVDRENSHVRRRRERKDPYAMKPAPQRIIPKPGLDSRDLRRFFKKLIADDRSEILMNITWGVCNLPSSPSCEMEVGTIISDRGVYLLEVLDPDRHLSRPLSWDSENLPLAKIMCCYHTTLRKIAIGIFDQSLTVESFEKGLVKRFVFFPHTYEKLNMFVENLKAAFDANMLKYEIISSEDQFPSESSELVIQNPGSLDMATLKDSLVRSRCIAQVGNFIAVTSKSTDSSPLAISFDAELMRVSVDTTAKFEIVQYVIVGQVSSDILPISNGQLHIKSRALILTNKTLYLCKEELDAWPRKSTSIRPPPFPRCTVIDAHPISRISGIKICDKSHPVVSCTDPIYEFSIHFEELDDLQLSPTLSAEWILCVHDKQYLDQLMQCVIHLSNELQKENQKLLAVKHTSSRLMNPLSPKPPGGVQVELPSSQYRRDIDFKVLSSRGSSPSFFSNRVLFEFSILTNYQRLKFFKRHVAQAEFLKSDETPLSVFLAHCSSTSSEDYVEIEACVIVSNYAIYLLSDVDNIQLWVEGGGVTSFQTRDLLDKKDSDRIRCFYRLWLNEMKQVNVGVFYGSVSVMDTKEPEVTRFTVHTENHSATLSFLSALSCVVDLHDTRAENEMDHLLSSYDLVVDEVKVDKPKVTEADKQHYVEFVYQSENKIDDLKMAMIGISPVIAKGMPIETCRSTLKILYQQVVLLVEELRIRDLVKSRFYPHLVFLTNYGVYVCLNKTSEKCSPSVFDPSVLSVKKWCHIDLLERIHVISPAASQYSCFNVIIYLRVISRASLTSEDANSLSLLVQNSEMLGCFLYHFSLMYYERCGRQISITRD